MIYLKSYNESLRDKMKPKSEDEIWKELKKLTPNNILHKSLEYNYFKGIKYVIEKGELNKNKIDIITNNLHSITKPDIIRYLLNIDEISQTLNADELYILEKYKLGLHQDEERKIEKEFISSFPNVKPIEIGDRIVYKSVFNKTLFEYDKVTKNFSSVLEVRFKLMYTYKISDSISKILIEGLAKRILNLDIVGIV